MNAARERLEKQRASGRELGGKLSEWDHIIAALSKNLQEARGDCARRSVECEALEAKTAVLQEQLKEEEDERAIEATRADVAVDELKAATRKKMGRPQGNAGATELEARWGTMTKSARSKAFWRHSQDIEQALVRAGIEDWSIAAFARVLDRRGLIPHLMSTKPLCAEKMSLASDLAGILAAEYNADLANHVIDEVELSQGQYQKLRLALCKTHTEDKGWQKNSGTSAHKPVRSCGCLSPSCR